MALNLSKQDREELMEIMAKAEPYSEDDPEVNTLDAKIDFDRWNAMMARRYLEQDDLEKAGGTTDGEG